MSDIFDVLADPGRRDLLRVLLDARTNARNTQQTGEVSVSELVALTGASQPTVSKQLKALRDAELVAVREDGQHRLYRLDEAPIASVLAWLADFAPRASNQSSPRAPRATEHMETANPGAESAVAEIATALGRTAASLSHHANTTWDAISGTLAQTIERLTERARNNSR
jgi:ArsR family transcriptional regulator